MTTITVKYKVDTNGNARYYASYGTKRENIRVWIYKFNNGDHAPFDAARKLIEKMKWNEQDCEWVGGQQDDGVWVYVWKQSHNVYFVPKA